MRSLVFLVLLLSACGGSSSTEDGGSLPDASSSDSAVRDAATRDGPSLDSGRDATVAPDAGTGGTLAGRYPGDVGLDSDPSVIFHDDFESGWGRWDAPTMDTRYLTLHDDASSAHAGSHYLESN